MTGHVLYSAGAVSVGYRISESQAGTVGADGNNAEAFSIAFNVNDSLTVSYAEQELEYDEATSSDLTAGVSRTEDIKAINAAYTMGAATIRTTFSEADNAAGVTGVDDEHMEVSLVLSF